MGATGRSAITDGGNLFRIGYQFNFGGAAYNGYMDELRLSDTALWTSNFTPSLSPNVPEPSTYAAIFGAVVLGFAAYKRRRAACVDGAVSAPSHRPDSS